MIPEPTTITWSDELGRAFILFFYHTPLLPATWLRIVLPTILLYATRLRIALSTVYIVT